MIILVIWLLFETHRGKAKHSMREEKLTYAIVSALFGLSYLGRVSLNHYDSSRLDHKYPFAYYMGCVSVYLFEGLSMGILMLFHHCNYRYRYKLKLRSLFCDDDDEEQDDLPYASIRFG